MVAVAQLVEPRFVVPVVVGSNPISHPTITNGPLAQPVEQGTLNPKVIGSIPIRPITKNRRQGLSPPDNPSAMLAEFLTSAPRHSSAGWNPVV